MKTPLLFCLFTLSAAQGFCKLTEPVSVHERLKKLESDAFKSIEESEKWMLSFWGDFLYWRSNIAGMPYALTYDLEPVTFPSPTDTINLGKNQKLENIRLDYSPGFRVGVSYTLPFDQWDFSLQWTQFVESQKASAFSSSTKDVATIWDQTGLLQASSAHATLHQHFTDIEFVLGKTFLWSAPFLCRIFFGGKGSWVKENQDLSYVGSLSNPNFSSAIPAVADVTLKNAFASFGLVTGLNAKWDIKWGLGIYGRGEIAVLWGKFHLLQNETITASLLSPSVISLPARNSLYAVKTNLVCAGGLQWKRLFFNDAIRFTLSAGYELNYWPNQVLLEQTITDDAATSQATIRKVSESGDISFQGYDFRVQIDF